MVYMEIKINMKNIFMQMWEWVIDFIEDIKNFHLQKKSNKWEKITEQLIGFHQMTK